MVLGTIGATTPFLGLFGTVVGIMGAFRKIGESKQAGIQVVGPYIAEALIATAVGIGIAVVALPCLTIFSSRLARTSIELRLAIEEFLEELTEAHGRDPDAGNPKSDDKSDGKDKHAKTASERRPNMAIGKVPGSAGEGDLDEEGIFAEINITPLTDIFLVLLIIFMVTSSVIADAGRGRDCG